MMVTELFFFVELHTALPVDPRWKEGNGMGEGPTAGDD